MFFTYFYIVLNFSFFVACVKYKSLISETFFLRNQIRLYGWKLFYVTSLSVKGFLNSLSIHLDINIFYFLTFPEEKYSYYVITARYLDLNT